MLRYSEASTFHRKARKILRFAQNDRDNHWYFHDLRASKTLKAVALKRTLRNVGSKMPVPH